MASGRVDREEANSSGEEGPLPPVSDRLGHLRPSRELLQFYRRKIVEYDSEYEQLLARLDGYKQSYELVHKNQWELRQKEEEISELQKALSDMQVFLFQEREQVLRLHAENDRLKLKELEDRKRIQHLLSLSQPAHSETTFFHQEPPAKVLVQQHRRHGREASPCPSGRGPGGHKSAQESGGTALSTGGDTENLLLTVEALKAQLEEQTRLCRGQVDALLEDRRVAAEETAACSERDRDRIAALTEQLQVAQSLLYDSTRDYLDLKYSGRAKERQWMAEKDGLLHKLDHYREQLDVSEGVDPVLGVGLGGLGGDKAAPAAQLRVQLAQTQQLADSYREQCVSMEEEVGRQREEAEAARELFRQRSEKLSKRLALMNSRYQQLEQRRAMEIEGYKSDIRLLRQRLKEVEKQLYKLTLSLGGDGDLEILSHVRRTASHSKKLMGDLQQLKGKVYSLENDVRHVHNH